MADPSVTLQQLKDAGVETLDLRPGRILVLSVDAPITSGEADSLRRGVVALLQEHGIKAPVLILSSSVTAQVVNLAELDETERDSLLSTDVKGNK